MIGCGFLPHPISAFNGYSLCFGGLGLFLGLGGGDLLELLFFKLAVRDLADKGLGKLITELYFLGRRRP